MKAGTRERSRRLFGSRDGLGRVRPRRGHPHSAAALVQWSETQFGRRGFRVLAELRRFEHFGEPKYLSLLEPTPEGRHYSGVGGTGATVILGSGWAGSSSFNFFSNKLSSASGSV